MRWWPTTSAAAVFFAFAGTDAICQGGAYGDTSTQVRKQWELGRRIANDLETRDGSINEPPSSVLAATSGQTGHYGRRAANAGSPYPKH